MYIHIYIHIYLRNLTTLPVNIIRTIPSFTRDPNHSPINDHSTSCRPARSLVLAGPHRLGSPNAGSSPALPGKILPTCFCYHVFKGGWVQGREVVGKLRELRGILGKIRRYWGLPTPLELCSLNSLLILGIPIWKSWGRGLGLGCRRRSSQLKCPV